MEIQIAVAKVDRFYSGEQGDQVEVIERPHGGISVILGEGKLNGQRSKEISRKAVHRVLSLIFEGIHDGAASRAVLSALKAEHRGEAELSLNILSCDLEASTILLTKNNPVPVFLVRNNQDNLISYTESEAIDPLKPTVYQFPIENNFTVVMFSDGVASAGADYGQPLQWGDLMETFLDEPDLSVQLLADQLLNQAIALDLGNPHDDMTVVVIRVNRRQGKPIRRISMVLPV